MTVRQSLKADSNNTDNANQNICAQAVAKAFDVAGEVRYLHTYEDVKRAIGKRYSVRSRLSKVKKGSSVGASRAAILKMIQTEGAIGAVIYIKGHVISFDSSGNVTDTDPRQRDRRAIKQLHLVFRHKGC